MLKLKNIRKIPIEFVMCYLSNFKVEIDALQLKPYRNDF